MASFQEFNSVIADAFKKLRDSYGFRFDSSQGFRVSLVSETCGIDLVFLHREDGYSVFFHDPQDTGGAQYSFDYIMALRENRDADKPLTPADEYLSDDEGKDDTGKIIREMDELERLIVRYCDDLLRGDFSKLRDVDGYAQFEQDVDRLTPVAINLDLADPISRKFWSGDLSWVRDLKTRISDVDGSEG